MTSIVKLKSGDRIYLYESISFRNKEGKPRNKRVLIGKIDPISGNPVYKTEYLERMAENGTPIEIPPTNPIFSINDVQKSIVKEYGTFYLLNHIAESTGLLAALQQAVPKYWQELFMLACYLLSSGDPFLYCESWIHETESLPVGSMASQRISELLSDLTNNEREAFYQAWCQLRSEQEYLALDITSISSYSELIDDVEWGYNRDHEPLPQINLCMLMGEKSKLPIYQTIYSGSLKDVSTLKTTLSKIDALSGGKPLLLVMDKGFFSKKNINDLLDSDKLRFVIAVPFRTNFAKDRVENERKEIDCVENTLVIGSDSIRAVSKQDVWNEDQPIYVHSYYNVLKATKIREDLYAHVVLLKELAQKNPTDENLKDEFEKYLLIQPFEETPQGYTVTINNRAINDELQHAGWMVLISNDIANKKEALLIYHQKDVVEKGFLRFKKSLDLGRLRVHRENSMQNKTFVGFLALIMLSQIHNVMLDQNLYKNMTMKSLLMTLSKLRVQHINDVRILFPLTKQQKSIFKAFGVDQPV
jgi:transposase